MPRSPGCSPTVELENERSDAAPFAGSERKPLMSTYSLLVPEQPEASEVLIDCEFHYI
jgi:hypothetical protein